MKKMAQKNKLERQHEDLFSDKFGVTAVPTPYTPYPNDMRVVQTVTTYSACEEPIPNPYKRS